MVYRNILILGVEMEGEVQGFQNARAHWQDHEAVKMVFRVLAHDALLDLEMASWASDHLKLVYWLSCLRMHRTVAYWH